MCLELLCTSTQSSNLKWVGGGGINSSRHQTSRWLKAAQSSTFGWSDAILFQGVGSSGAPPPPHSYWGSVTQLLRRHAPTVRRIIRCWRPRVQVASFASTRPSDRPTLHLDQGVRSSGAEGFSWRISVWIQTERRIDRWYPHSYRWTIRCYCLRCSSSATRPTLLKVDRRFIWQYLGFDPVNQLVRWLHRRLLNWYHRFIRRWLFFSFSCSVMTLVFLTLACGFLAFLGPRSVYKYMLKQYG
jgi:hypothetical protein